MTIISLAWNTYGGGGGREGSVVVLRGTRWRSNPGNVITSTHMYKKKKDKGYGINSFLCNI